MTNVECLMTKGSRIWNDERTLISLFVQVIRTSFVIRHSCLVIPYGLVVVVVVVSSCLTTTGWANTTLRTTTRSPTVE